MAGPGHGSERHAGDRLGLARGGDGEDAEAAFFFFFEILSKEKRQRRKKKLLSFSFPLFLSLGKQTYLSPTTSSSSGPHPRGLARTPNTNALARSLNADAPRSSAVVPPPPLSTPSGQATAPPPPPPSSNAPRLRFQAPIRSASSVNAEAGAENASKRALAPRVTSGIFFLSEREEVFLFRINRHLRSLLSPPLPRSSCLRTCASPRG